MRKLYADYAQLCANYNRLCADYEQVMHNYHQIMRNCIMRRLCAIVNILFPAQIVRNCVQIVIDYKQ